MNKLINRPLPIYQESITSYVSRLATANYTSVDTIFHAFNIAPVRQLRPSYICKRNIDLSSSLRNIEHLADLDNHSLDYKLPFSLDAKHISWYGLTIPKNLIRQTAFVCPHCLNKNPIEKSCWYIKGYNYCAEHEYTFQPIDDFYIENNQNLSAIIEQAFHSANYNQTTYLNNLLREASAKIRELSQALDYIPTAERPQIAAHSTLQQALLLDP